MAFSPQALRPSNGTAGITGAGSWVRARISVGCRPAGRTKPGGLSCCGDDGAFTMRIAECRLRNFE